MQGSRVWGFCLSGFALWGLGFWVLEFRAVGFRVYVGLGSAHTPQMNCNGALMVLNSGYSRYNGRVVGGSR